MPPSRGKKPSKPPPSPPSSGRTPSSRTPSTPPSRRAVTDEAEEEEEDPSQLLLKEAAAKFPRLISETAFRGRIMEVDASTQFKAGQARVWLSQSAMESSSLVAGSLVSVSLASSGKNHSDGFPLDALSDGCARYFGVDIDDSGISEVGRYFAIATVFPSTKVLKDGVRLSWCLSCTMGVPATSKIVFVSPIEVCSTPGAQNLNDKSIISHTKISYFPLHKCKDLYLTLAPPSTKFMTNAECPSPANTSTESEHSVCQNGKVASPKTPSYQSKIYSPASSASPSLSKGRQDPVTSLDRATYMEADMSVIGMALEDEKTSELMQIYASRWLRGRYLLCGNFLTLPLCRRLCVFHVQGANGSQVMSSCHDITNARKCNLPSHESQMSSGLEHMAAAFLVDCHTRFHLSESMVSGIGTPSKESFLSKKPLDKDFRSKEAHIIPSLGGLLKEYSLLKEIISFSLSHSDKLPSYKGVLLHGPPGTGKTSLVSLVAHDVDCQLFSINGPEIVGQYYGESERALQEVFDSARRAAPAVVFIDELDAIAPARKDGGEELSSRMVATLSNLMDEITRGDEILLIAATNRPDSIDPALRRSGRLDREIEIGVPSPDQRLDILNTLLSKMDHSLSNVEIHSLAMATHGFVGADLAALCNEAAMIALRAYIKFRSSKSALLDQLCGKQYSRIGGYLGDISGSNILKYNGRTPMNQMDSVSLSLSKLAISCCEKVVENTDTTQTGLHRTHEIEDKSMLKVTAEDFDMAKKKVRPSSMREVMLELPKVFWEDVGGQNEVKKQLIEAVQWPQMYPDAFKRIGICPPRGLLMFGPPGCSKTLMARAVASEAKLNFLAVKGSELFSKWVGESEKAVKSLFAKARVNSPSIIFFDEMDGLAITRGQEQDGTSVGDRVLSQLLIELDGLDQRFGVTVIAATNRPDKIDPALLRPGRFDRHLDVKPPNKADRVHIFQIHTRNMPCRSDVSLRDLSHLTEGYTGADIKLICREAAIAALEESFEISEISMEHFKIGIQRVVPLDVQFYLEISEKFKRYVNSTVARDT